MSYHTFPETFVWGAATSSYQIEGATREGGRGPSIWDTMCSEAGRIANGDTGDVACDHYHHVESDVRLMKDLGLKAYRFSIAWPRIIPDGVGPVNPAGIEFYNKLIDALVANGIVPWITLYHWDLPQKLEDKFGGWLGREVVEAFREYSRVCFEAFGDRVKHWITLNEPWCSSLLGYGNGEHAPGRSKNADTETYIAGHHLLLAHAHAVHVYRTEFAPSQKGLIGITNNCDFRFPLTESAADRAASERSLEFFLGWFADPIWKGDYPAVMRKMLGDRLPRFSSEERDMLLGSSDFFGLNHYSSSYCAEPKEQQESGSGAVAGNGGIFDDPRVELSSDPKWKVTHMNWCIVPDGCRELLKWIDNRYDHPPIYITENGCAMEEPDLESALTDHGRRDFFEGYLRACGEALDAGVDLRGYFAWSLMDNFEWAWGYERRFGLCRVDFDTLERTPKLSAKWYRDTIVANGKNIQKKLS